MVSVKIDFMKKDFFWIVMLIVFVGISLVYAYGGNQPSVMGHSAGEIDLSAGVNGDAIFNGNVGIGTTNPATKLEIKQSSNDWKGGLRIVKSDSTHPLAFYINDAYEGVLKLGGHENIRMAYTVGDVYLVPDTGKVGIGTTSPQATLDVDGSVKVNGFTLTPYLISQVNSVWSSTGSCSGPTDTCNGVKCTCSGCSCGFEYSSPSQFSPCPSANPNGPDSNSFICRDVLTSSGGSCGYYRQRTVTCKYGLHFV